MASAKHLRNHGGRITFGIRRYRGVTFCSSIVLLVACQPPGSARQAGRELRAPQTPTGSPFPSTSALPDAILGPLPGIVDLTPAGTLLLTLAPESSQFPTALTIRVSLQLAAAGAPYRWRAMPWMGGRQELIVEDVLLGQTLVTVDVLDRDGIAVGSASGALRIVRGESRLNLVMRPFSVLSITRLQPAGAVVGTTAALLGTGFGASSGASFSMALGETELNGSTVNRVSDFMITYRVPQLRPGLITVRVDDHSTRSTEVFSPVASIGISPPASEAFLPGGRARFTAVAYDLDGQVVASPSLAWRLIPEIPCADPDCGGFLDDTGLWIGETVPERGVRFEERQFAVLVGTGPVTATASFRTRFLESK